MTLLPPKLQNVELWLPCGHCVTMPLYKTGNPQHKAVIFKADYPNCCKAGKRLPKWELSLEGFVTQTMFRKLRQLDLLPDVEDS